MGQPDRQRTVHRKLEGLADMPQCSLNIIINLMQLLCAFVGLN